LAGLDEKHGWYTTNVEPSKIRTLLENGDTLREFLSVFCEKGVWEALESAYHGELITEGAKAIDFLEKKQLLMDNKLTSKGFTCYVVLGHLAFNTAKKLDIRKPSRSLNWCMILPVFIMENICRTLLRNSLKY
jgi:hypothetical protein